MPRTKKTLILSQPVSNGQGVKVQLDHRTVITLKDMSALDPWKKRYPQAQVIR